MNSDDPVKDLEPIRDEPVAPGVAIGALALNFALKYHDINTIKDGALYQQYKLEGRNIRDLHLDVVFETAIRMEQHLLATSDRVAGIVFEALAYDPAEDDGDGLPAENGASPSTEGSELLPPDEP